MLRGCQSDPAVACLALQSDTSGSAPSPLPRESTVRLGTGDNLLNSDARTGP